LSPVTRHGLSVVQILGDIRKIGSGAAYFPGEKCAGGVALGRGKCARVGRCAEGFEVRGRRRQGVCGGG